jgi:hypothetical protein
VSKAVDRFKLVANLAQSSVWCPRLLRAAAATIAQYERERAGNMPRLGRRSPCSDSTWLRTRW